MKFRTATSEDIDLVTMIMTEAFNFDTAFHLKGQKEGGPPGYNDGSLAQRILSDNKLTTYILVEDGRDFGFVTFEAKESVGILEKFCIKAEHIGQGFGTQAWNLLEAKTHFDSWQLETPDYSLRNHSFYKKCGFHEINRIKYGKDSYSLVFEKMIKVDK